LYRLGEIQISDIHIDEQTLLNEASWQVRKLAVSLLTELGSKQEDLIKVLLTALRDPHAEVRRTAAKGLKERGETRDDILKALCTAQYDPDPAVRTAAEETLDHFNGGQEESIEKEEIEETGLDRATRALPKDVEQDKKLLVSDEWLALDNQRARKRRQAIIRLASARVKEQQVLNLLREIAYHKTGEDPSNIKQAVVTILQQLQYVVPDGAPQAIEILLKLADDPDPYVREIAIIIVGQLDDTRSRLSETLQGLMKTDPDPFVREAATIILGYASNGETQNRSQDQAENNGQKSLEALLPKLANLEADSTKATIDAIEKLGRDYPDVKSRLAEIVSDDRVIKELVSKPIEIYRQQIYIEALIRNLQILKYFGSDQPQVLKILFANLTSKNEDIRYKTIEALSSLGANNEEVVSKLINILSDPAEMIRNKAVNVLGELSKEHHHVLKAMVDALQTNPLVDRSAIAEALRRSGICQPFIIEALLSLLGHFTSASEMLEVMLTSHPADRQAVVEALAHLGAGNDRVLKELLSTLKDPDLTVRTATVSALARLGKGNKTVCRALVKALREDKSPSVRQAAASALGQVGDENCSIIDELLRARKDRDLHVRKAAFPTLIEIGREHQHVRNVLQNDFQGSTLTKRELALAFAQLQQVEPVFMPMLLHVLQDKDPSVQGHIALALGKINGDQQHRQRVSRVLIETLREDISPTLRSDILLALGKISSHDAVNPKVHTVLMDALNDQDDGVKYNAAFSLAQQDHYLPEVVSVLLYALLDTEALIRQEAITLLSHIADKHPNIVKALVRSLSDADQSVREAAANALARSDDSKDRSIIGEKLNELLDSNKNIVDKQLTADAAIEATLSALQRVTGGT
jgi:HEAT repeat protein